MRHRIVVINPNSTQAVTDAISQSVQVHRHDTCQIDCLTVTEAPPGIATQSHKAAVVAPMQTLITQEQPTADAFVIACYGDPGLQAAREFTKRPVFGIGEISFYTAMAMGDQFGIISTDRRACQRHIRYARELGISQRLVDDLSIDIPILELEQNPEKTLQHAVNAGKDLHARGAQSLIMGCAGLAVFRSELEQALGINVIEPAMVTVGWACAAIRSGLTLTPAC